MKQLEDNVDKNRKNLDKFEKSMLDQKANNEIKKQSDEVRNLRDKAFQQSGQIIDLLRMYAKQSIELNELKIKNGDQSSEISDLKKDLDAVQETNKNLIEDERQMKKDLAKIQDMNIKLINDNEKMEEENSKLKVRNICYFVGVIHNNYDVDYNKAVDICKKSKANVGSIRDEESYNAIVNYSRRNIPKERMWPYIWTEIHFDPMTGDVAPADSFT
ncbi:uncharacterized protein LOC144425584 [Styela clava]